MAVDFGKLNKAGLGASTFGARKTTGTSAQAAKNLQSSSAATRSSVFSFKGSPRTNWVPGQHVSKGQHQYNYQGMRASLNGASGPRRSYAPQFSGPVGNYGMQNVKVNNDYAKGMVIGQTIVAGMSLLNQLGVFGGNDGVSSTSLGGKLGNALSGLGGGGVQPASDAIASTIGTMSGATDSSSLRAAIAEAKMKQAELQEQSPKLQEAANDAQGKMDGLAEKVADDQAACDKLTGEVSQKEQSVASCKTKLQSLNSDYAKKCEGLETANANLDKATTELNEATSALATAEGELATAQALPPDTPGRDAKIQAAQTKVDNARARKQKAETDKAAKEKAQQDAQAAKEKAYNELQTGKEDVKKAEDQLNKAQKELKDKKAELDAKKKDLEKSKKALADAKEAVEKFAANSQDLNALASNIKAQEKRLEKLEKAEIKEFNKLEKAIDKDNARNSDLMGKVDTSDGVSKRELKRLDKVKRNNEENEARHIRAAQLEGPAFETSLKNAPMIKGSDGNEYKTFTLAGETYHYRNGQPITADELPDEIKAQLN